MTQHKTVKLTDFTPDPNNANKGTQRGRGLLENSLQKLGAGRSVLADKNGVLIAGNKTLQTAVESGFENAIVVETDGTQLVVVKRTDLDLSTDAKAKELAVADNRIGEISLEWDAEVLSALSEEFDLSSMFFEEELEDLWKEWASPDQGLPLSPEEEEENASDLIEKADSGKIESRVKLGEIWGCGKHKIACGDSTSTANIAKLMGGVLADCCWTDPPYGVSYVGKTADALTIENDGAANLPSFIDDSFAAIATALKPGSAVYVAHPAGALQAVFLNTFIDRFSFRQQLIWVKNAFALGRSDYHYRHEPILFGYTKGGEGRRGRGSDNWFGDNAQDSVFEFNKPMRNGEHPTMKPLELIQAMLSNSTGPSSVLFEPFSGSGSTMIAAHQMEGNRRVFGFELSEAYCEVILRRYEALTGDVAELVGHL
jgi:DNA modification methylase